MDSLYLALQIFSVIAVYFLLKATEVKSRLAFFTLVLAVSAWVTYLNVGALGVVLGGPSIVMSAILVSGLYRKEAV